MKILAIGDTHNRLNMVYDIWQKLTDIDLVIHTGDFRDDAKKLQQELGVPFVYVKGNCDGSYSGSLCDPQGGDFAVVETEKGKILVTHGHNEHVNYSMDNLRYKALENGCMAVVFGHTHRSVIEQTEDPAAAGGILWFINPGSLPQPRDGSGGSYAIIRTSEERFDATVVYYNTVMSAGRGGSGVESHGASAGRESKKSGDTGFISDLLNYSDRF
ncbi:MAG: metallophosphoesterase [Clostridia bacterium]|nr:metallophosphoesterase [Clostridia bacterium]